MIGALESVWHFFFGWPALAILIGIAATAAAVFSENIIVKFAIPDLRKWAVVVAVIAFSFTAISGKYYNDGLAEKQRQWDSALVREGSGGEKDRSDAVRTVGPMPADRGVFRSDPFNRNRSGRPVE